MTRIELIAAVLFGLAVVHTFLVSRFEHWATQFREGSVGENLFHLLGEVEVVFGLWAAVLIVFITFSSSFQEAVHYVESLNFSEPIFVFSIMVVASTRPILNLTNSVLLSISNLIPMPSATSYYIVALTVGPLLGSFITEPAAMTVVAFLLRDRFMKHNFSNSFLYATLGLLFVNISIGGTLTHFAAPPVVMVASKWGWGIEHMFTQFGWKATTAVLVSTALVTFRFRKELAAASESKTQRQTSLGVPLWLVGVHILFLVLIVIGSHHPVISLGSLLLFLGVAQVTQEYQSQLKVREGLLVGFFLAGLVVLGSLQRWWLEPLLTSFSSGALFVGAAGLTAITDNAALTYLGSQVPNLSDLSKYALVSGSVAGGGLTVIANAPNPAGYGILNSSFGPDGIHPLKLLIAALVPTAIAMAAFWFLP